LHSTCIGVVVAAIPTPMPIAEKHSWMWFFMSCKMVPHPTLTFKHYESQTFQNASITSMQAMASYKYFKAQVATLCWHIEDYETP